MKKLSLFLAGIMVFSFCMTFAGCASVKDVKTSSKTSDSTKVTVKNADKSLSLTVPKHWNPKDSLLTDDETEIGVSDRAQGVYVEVKKTDKGEEFSNLSEYISSLKLGFSSVIKKPVISDESKGTIDGRDAVAIEVSGSYDSIDLVYYVYVIDGRDSFYEVYGWTPQANAEQNKPTIVNVIKTFKATDKAST